MNLEQRARLTDPDAVFAALVQAHDGLDEAASRRLDAALVLILVNQVGDDATVLSAIKAAQAASAAGACDGT